jgi:UDP-glucose 4-epimerase
MRVLVAGGAGYIGSVAVERLRDDGQDVVVIDNLIKGHRAAVPADVPFHDIDLRDGAAVDRVVSDGRFDAVMHFAALTLVGESVEEPAKYYQANVVGGLTLLESARRAGIPRFVFSSTAAVYGEPERLPIREEDPKQPINPYGETKWIIERALEAYSSRYDLNYAAFRYFNVAGATEARGEDHHPETHVIPIALFTLLGKRDKFMIFGTDYPTEDGTAVRDYVHVVDLVDAHVAALGRLDSSLGPINLGTKDGFSVRQIVDAVQRVTGRTLPVVEGPRRAGDPAALIADATRARELLGWEPERSTMDEMIGSAWAWYQAHPEGYRDGLG